MNKVIKILIFIMTQIVNWIMPLLFLYIIMACIEDGLLVSYIVSIHLGILFTFILAVLHFLLKKLKHEIE